MSSSKAPTATSVGPKLTLVDYEVFGTVQGVFFRKYTKKMADKLYLSGWVKNTDRKTVMGQLQGPEEKITVMKNWLKTEGSPRSKIRRCIFKNEYKLDAPLFHEFRIVLK
ncbi:acylphosphatase-1-like [Gigantopelta aegis]|uniref:acylphosphatase-1-like n=1 Tax=Gigantopelta aegis TaxID=1735272 RepID=UPI001B889466|nr:acylphosphatase-1-like [Gigantopelta aegis]